MGIIAWIIVGLVAGWLAEQFTGREHGLLKNLIVGVVGALVGGLLFSGLLGFHYARGLNLATIFVATIGAIVFLYVVDWLRGSGASRVPDRWR
ncbi:MAG: GlsB/YeaQ/YmgE family stress response membrane protein [Hyphomicrobiaceae bacterium]|nr:GlsB/YeaQ/YmgE family stress response membrane protein [Hyphomicrobiaceae bacterium]